MMKLKAYTATTMKTRYQKKNLVRNTGGNWGGQELKYLRKLTTSVKRTCKSLWKEK